VADLYGQAAGQFTSGGNEPDGYLEIMAQAVGLWTIVADGTASGLIVRGVLVTQLGTYLDVTGTTTGAVTQLGAHVDVTGTVPADATQLGVHLDVDRVIPINVTQAGLTLDVDKIVPANVTQLLLLVDAKVRRRLTSTYCWEFHIYNRAGTYLGYLDGAYNKSYAAELNDCGGGQFSIHADDPDATSTNIAVGNLVTVRYANQDVGTWVMEDIDEVLVGQGEDEEKVITVSGRGAISLLEDGIVYPSDIEDFNTTERAFEAVPKAEIFVTLWDEFVDRGGGDMTPDFTDEIDSDSAAWEDTATLSFRAGQTLLDVMRHLAALGIDFTIDPDRTLSCRPEAGSDLSASVVFRHGHNLIACARKTMGGNVTNAVLGEGSGVFVETEDATSISARGRREGYVPARNTADSTQVGVSNTVILNEYKNPPTAIQLAVLDDQSYPFITYNLGDTVRVEVPDEISADYRILAITMKERTNPCDLAIVLELNSMEAEYIIKLNRALQASLQAVHVSPAATSNVAVTDSAQLVSSSGVGMGDDAIKEQHVDWGTSATQVSAVDVPILDAGGYFTAAEVEAALQELAAGSATPPDTITDAMIDWGTGAGQVSAVDVPIADAGSYLAASEVETALQEIAAGTVFQTLHYTGGTITGGTQVWTFGTVVPAAGVWAVGNMVWNASPVAGGTIGWVCVTAGTPGTWQAFGSIWNA